MPSIDIVTPVSSAPTDRLALGLSWVRPGVAGIGGSLNPSFIVTRWRDIPTGGGGSHLYGRCFEGNEE